MRATRIALVVAVTCAACAVAARGQAPSPPAAGAAVTTPVPSTRSAPTTGTGRIRGRVMADASTPVRRAEVRLGGALAVPPAITDEDGRYEFARLPAGRYQLSATKAGFVRTSYGRTPVFPFGSFLTVADGQVNEAADLVMPRGHAIAGTLVDEHGEPLPNATVVAARATWPGGGRRLQSVGEPARSDDLGQYRVHSLPPGEYHVVAWATMREPMSEVGTGMTSPSPARRMGYGPSFYRGKAADPAARKVTVTTGRDATGVDVQLTPVRLARVRGIVLGSDGQPVPGARVEAEWVGGVELTRDNANVSGTTRDGAFQLPAVPPGAYILRVFGPVPPRDPSPTNTRSTVRSDFASLPLAVDGTDIPDLVVRMSRGSSALGRIVFEGARPRSTSGLRILAMPADELAGLGRMRSTVATPAPDDTFSMPGIGAGLQVLRLDGLPRGWSLKAVRLDGADIVDTGTRFNGTDPVSGLEMVVAATTTEISVEVTTVDGEPARACTVIIFADDARRWRPESRWVAGRHMAGDATFQVREMPAGIYDAIAVDDAEPPEWGDPEVLARLRSKAQRFTLADGQSKMLALTLSHGGS